MITTKITTKVVIRVVKQVLIGKSDLTVF